MRLIGKKMDVVKAVRHYVNKMVSEFEGMKVLLLDKSTVCVVGVVGLCVWGRCSLVLR